jgi:hypothetical protein
MSYLTPDWLLGDINQMLRTSKKGAKAGYGDILSKSDFKEQYRTGAVNPTFGDTRYYYNYDFGDIGKKYHGADVWGETKAGGLGTNVGNAEGYRFSSEDDAYKTYLESFTGQSSEDYFNQSDFGTQTANIFDPQSFGEGVARAEGDFPAGVDASSKTAFTPEMFKKLRTEYYQPQIEQERGSLIDKLIGKQKLAKSRGGGFAGYGGREKASEAVEGQYRTGVEDIYSGIETQKASGLQDIYDVLSQYEVS